MLSQQKLLKVIDDDLGVCRGAGERIDPSDTEGKERNTLEFNTLMRHFQWAQAAGDDQRKLELVVSSLETNGYLRRYRRWGERSEAD